MFKSNKLRLKRIKTYLLPILTIFILFIIARHLMIRNINEFLINKMMEDSNRHAETHTSRLSNSIQASEIMDDLLEEKLLAATTTVVNSYDKLSNEFLKEISQDLNVDKIYWYNSKGEIIYSANDYIGWKAKEGDPVYDFMRSDKGLQIDAIRPDVDSGIHLKYGHKKTINGEFVQVGILAENIYQLSKNFCTQNLIEDIAGEDEILHVYYLNNKNKLIFCNDNYKNDEYVLDSMEEEALKKGSKLYTRRIYKSEDTYQAFLPIYNDNERVGTLILFYSMESTNDLISKVSSIAMVLLVMVFLIFLLMLLNINKKNRSIEKLAYYDKVTDYYNKEYLISFLKNREWNKIESDCAMLVIKWHGFNLIKKVYGQEHLENLLIEIKEVFSNLKIDKKYIFRYSDNSFCICIEDYENRESIINLSKKIADGFDRIVDKADYGQLINFKLGILLVGRVNNESTEILKHIDIVLEKIDEDNSLVFELYDTNIQRDLDLDERIEKELRKDIHKGCEGFYLLFQPQVNLKTNKIIGFEALTRWNNSELGIISPVKFIEIAEKYFLITKLGEWIIKESFRFMNSLERNNYKDIKVSINISVVQLLQDHFVGNLINEIKNFGINPKNLILEITETTIMSNYDLINGKLKALKKEGISIALDDFGTGYASLSRLRQLNIDILKIDKLFIDNINEGNEDIFVNSILALAKELNLITVAEGVETEEQKQYLKDKQCNIIQGFIFSKAIFECEAIKIIKDNNGRIRK